jgi:hypothetical protein
MVGRKKERSARKTGDSKPKAAALVAAAGRPVGLPVAPVPSDQPPPRNLRANESIQRAWEEPPVTPPQTGIQGATATAVAGSPAQAPIRGVTAPSVIAGVAATGRTNLMGLASLGVAATGKVDGDMQPASAIMPSAGGVQADADRVPARTRKQTTGSRPARRVTRARLLHQADVAEAAQKKLAPPHGGRGHNSQRRAIGWPLTQIQYDRAMAAIRSLKAALAAGGRLMMTAGRTLARTATISQTLAGATCRQGGKRVCELPWQDCWQRSW